jgi:hypothetical protein
VKNRRMGVVELTDVGGVDRSAGKQGWGWSRESLGMITDERRIRMPMASDHVSAMLGAFDNNIGATFAITQLGNGASFGVTLNLHRGHDEVSDIIGDWCVGVINAGAMRRTVVLS